MPHFSTEFVLWPSYASAISLSSWFKILLISTLLSIVINRLLNIVTINTLITYVYLIKLHCCINHISTIWIFLFHCLKNWGMVKQKIKYPLQVKNQKENNRPALQPWSGGVRMHMLSQLCFSVLNSFLLYRSLKSHWQIFENLSTIWLKNYIIWKKLDLLLLACPMKIQSIVFGPIFTFLDIGRVTFARYPHTCKYL